MSLALIVGSGRLPVVIDATLRARGIEAPAFALEGTPCHLAHAERFRLEQLGGFIAGLKARGIDTICMAGGVRRPDLDPDAVDDATAPLLVRIGTAMAQGDDAALREFITLFEEHGLTIRAAHEICPELLLPAGVPSRVQLRAHHRDDAARGAQIVAALGAADVGQACVVSRGLALAVEALPGTDRMMRALMADPKGAGQDRPDALRPESLMRDVLPLTDWLAEWFAQPQRPGRDPALPPGGILYKGAKPGQDRRVDLPVIGPDTMLTAAELGLEGVVIEAGNVMVLDCDAVLRIADESGLFLWVRTSEEG